jgi:hypothetical protein
MMEICRKASLTRSIARMAARCPTDFAFYPRSFILPDQVDDLMNALKQNYAKVGMERVG